jgi:hypothetical protein
MGNQDNSKNPKQDSGVRRQDEQQQQQGRDRDKNAGKQGAQPGGQTKQPNLDQNRH